MSRPFLIGYTDRLAAVPGDRVEVMMSADPPTSAHATLIRLGYREPDSLELEPTVVDLGVVDVPYQRSVAGSCVKVQGMARAWPRSPFVAVAMVMPTFASRRQAIMAQGTPLERWWLGLDNTGRPCMATQFEDVTLEAIGPTPLVDGAWYVVAGGVDPDNGLSLAVAPLRFGAGWRTALSHGVRGQRATTPGIARGLLASPLFIAAADDGNGAWTDCFDGKIEAPCLLDGVLDDELVDQLSASRSPSRRAVAAWDFAAHLGRTGVPSVAVAAVDRSDLDGECMNSPLRAATGHCWDGTEQDFRNAPRQYAAIHFHSDDLDDCRWGPVLDLTLPPDLPSGVYGVRLRSGDGRTDRLPLFVRPVRPTAAIALLIPTASYLAYANDHPGSDGQMAQAVASKTPVLFEDDLLMHERREWGLSCYDAHADGSGVAYSSRRRPLVNMRPTHRYHVGAWQLPADMAIVSWLEANRLSFDVLTDEDLDAQGSALLEPYRVVLTATHPEYYSTSMLDAVDAWLDGGGRLVYLGANGFYWRIAFDRDRPWIIEVRRGYSGSRAWESAPGETHLAFNGEQGGMWRHLGRAPQRMTGVGYAAQGFDQSGWFRRLPDSHDPRAAFVFDGVDSDVFGVAGRIGGGAAGQELDRYDVALGTPHDALLLATSEGLTEGYLRCVEEVNFTVQGISALHDPKVRADVVYFVRPGGGAVFSTGSIAWAGSLGVDEGVSRISLNVIKRFEDPRPLVW